MMAAAPLAHTGSVTASISAGALPDSLFFITSPKSRIGQAAEAAIDMVPPETSADVCSTCVDIDNVPGENMHERDTT